MKNIQLAPEIIEKCPQIRLGLWECRAEMKTEGNDELWEAIEAELEMIAGRLETPEIAKLPTVAATRAAYKACGKDPSRYRPSAEALLRRVVKGKGLYKVNNVVDLLNLVSVNTGFSIGGWDADKIEGAATLGIGAENEPYEAIGRGELNIAGLPTMRDELSAFGTPTSDCVRTSVTEETSRFLFCIYDFGSDSAVDGALQAAKMLLRRYANASGFERKIISSTGEVS